ncbi:MAG: Unknown protein, partial [uncultured Sulfurovum sp.]
HLLKEGFEVLKFESLSELEKGLKDISLIIINDISPNIDGMNFIEYIREKESNIPLIFLAENLSEKEIAQAFANGADDCIIKPFGLVELLCRIKALLKRSYGLVQEELKYENIVMDLKQRTCMIDDREVDLTKLEFDLLSFFIQHKNIILDREYILKAVWHDSNMKKRTINVSVNRLVKKIDPENRYDYFTAIRGIGYRFG